MTAFITAFTVVVLAEMGDKTQLLAMAFAGKYSWKTVMAGVFAATVLNHFLAVIVGVYLGTSIDAHSIQIAASAAFILLYYTRSHNSSVTFYTNHPCNSL